MTKTFIYQNIYQKTRRYAAAVLSLSDAPMPGGLLQGRLSWERPHNWAVTGGSSAPVLQGGRRRRWRLLRGGRRDGGGARRQCPRLWRRLVP